MADSDIGFQPESIGPRIIYLVQNLTQLVSLAVLIGVIVDRITEATARILFAKYALISLYNGEVVVNLAEPIVSVHVTQANPHSLLELQTNGHPLCMTLRFILQLCNGIIPRKGSLADVKSR